jgi:RNA polymerase sigma-70 factor (ECF subfamily)
LPRKNPSRRPELPKQANRTDQELLEGIRQSREEDFNLLYDRYFHRVFGFVYSRLRNRADAEEVVQEVFTAVFCSVEAYRGQSSLLSWIYGIAKNTVNNHVRRARAQQVRVERAEDELRRSAWSLDACTPEERLTLTRCAKAVNDRLSSVSDWQSEVFVMRHLENLSIGEIARRTSRSSDAVRSSLYRMKRLVVDAVDSGVASAN